MFKSSKKKSSSSSVACTFCEFLSILMTALATICTLAALADFYKAHVLSTGLVFGSSIGSLSVLALVFSLFLLKKTCEGCACEMKPPAKK